MGVALPNQDLAPFYDENADGLYDPLDGDYPVYDEGNPNAIPDAMAWTVFNDIGGPHTNTGGDQLGVEVQLTAYVFLCEEEAVINTTLFTSHKIINKSQENINDFKFGLWMDYNLGCWNDDFIGSAPELNTCYIYNGTNEDNNCQGTTGYGLNPPAFGTTFLNTPLNYFLNYIGDFAVNGEPATPLHYYYYMSGKWKDGTPMTTGGDGYAQGTPETNWMHHSNPNDSSPDAWSEVSLNNFPSDRRGVASTDLGILTPGEMVQIDAAHSYHREEGRDHLENVDLLYDQIPIIQDYYDNALMTMPCSISTECLGEDCVWPGDVNNNGIVNHLDILPLGLRMGETGSSRNSNSTLFRPFESLDWINTLSILNPKYADCKGDGIVDLLDQVVIENNYDQINNHYMGPIGSDEEGLDLRLEFLNVLTNSTNVISNFAQANRFSVMLGSEDNPITDIIGLGFTIEFDPTYLSIIPLSTPDLVDGAQSIKFNHNNFFYSNKIDFAIVNTDGQSLATAENTLVHYLRLYSYEPQDTCVTTEVKLYNVQVIQSDGTILEIGNQDILLEFEPCVVSTKNPSAYFQDVQLFPNPAKDYVLLDLQNTPVDHVRILNTLGQEVAFFEQVNHQLRINTASLPSGVYFVQVQKDQRLFSKKLQVVR